MAKYKYQKSMRYSIIEVSVGRGLQKAKGEKKSKTSQGGGGEKKWYSLAFLAEGKNGALLKPWALGVVCFQFDPSLHVAVVWL